MNPAHRDFFNLRRLPGSISAEQAAILLGTAETNIPVLVSKGFLRPLASPLSANAPRRFSSTVVEKLAGDADEMNRMQQILTKHHRSRNGTDILRTAGATR